MVLTTKNTPAKKTAKPLTDVLDVAAGIDPGAIPANRFIPAEELEQPGIPEVEAMLPVVNFEEHFRLADTHLQNAVRHLRKLRHIPAARDALRLVRQAQNNLMDAEDS